MRILLDMDGVVADFVDGALKHHRKTLSYHDTRWAFHEQIGLTAGEFWSGFDREFWANLPRTHDMCAIVPLVDRLDPNAVVVSSPCPNAGCIDGKIDWLKKQLPHYHAARRYFFGSPKHLLAHPGAVLIDDSDANVRAFRDAGGNAILVPRPWNEARNESLVAALEPLWRMFRGS